MKKRLGEMLLERGLINVDQLNAALGFQRQWGVRLGSALVARGLVAEGMLTQVLSESLGIPMVDIARVVVEQRALQLVPRRLAEQHEVLPIGVREQPNGRKFLYLAMADPLNATAIDEIAFTTDSIVKPAIAQISSLQHGLRRYYGGEDVEVPPLMMTRPAAAAPRADVDDALAVVTGRTEERAATHRASAASSASEASISQRPPAASVAGGVPLTASAVGPLQAPPDYAGLPAFSMPPRAAPGPAVGLPQAMPRTAELEELEALEKKFWALLRVLTRRGVVTREEFLAELRSAEGQS